MNGIDLGTRILQAREYLKSKRTCNISCVICNRLQEMLQVLWIFRTVFNLLKTAALKKNIKKKIKCQIFILYKNNLFKHYFFKRYSHHLFLRQILRLFCFYCFFLNLIWKKYFCSLKWGFPTLKWNLVLHYLKLNFPHNFRSIFAISTVLKLISVNLKWDATKTFLITFRDLTHDKE